MEYRKKLIVLGSLAAFLFLVFVLSIIFDPARRNIRNERFTWISSASRDQADRIEIFQRGERIELFLRGGQWFVLDGILEIPARQGRIDDLFRLISTHGAFPRRGSNASSHGELGLDGSTRLVIRGGAGFPILDLLVGVEDPSGTEVFLRRSGENEFRSGDRLIGTYVNSARVSWCNLNFFENMNVSQVQRMHVSFFDYHGTGFETEDVNFTDYTISRSGENWLMGSEILDSVRTENWIRRVLEAAGENYLPIDMDISTSIPSIAAIRAELGDGSFLEIKISAADEDDNSTVELSGLSYLIVISQWTRTQLLRNREHFFETAQ